MKRARSESSPERHATTQRMAAQQGNGEPQQRHPAQPATAPSVAESRNRVRVEPLPPGGMVALQPWVAPAHAPVVTVQESHYRQLLPLMPELWKLILGHLEERDRCRAMESCLGMYGCGVGLGWSTGLAAHSATARLQRAACRRSLDPVLTAYQELRARSHDRRNPAAHAREFGQRLLALGQRFRYVDVVVWEGFEDAVLNALGRARHWQHATIRVTRDGQADFIKTLEQALARQTPPRQCWLDLSVYDPPDVDIFLPDGTGLKLDGLHLESIVSDEMQDFTDFLGSDNDLERFHLTGDATPHPVLACLKEGSPRLSALRLDDFPEDPSLLLEVLQSKPSLRCLRLANGRFSQDGLSLAAVLQAAPKLASLELEYMIFEAGAGEDCYEALRSSALQEISVLECGLEVIDAGVGALQQQHASLLAGLTCAPELSLFLVKDKNRDDSTQSLLEAFVLNPAARVLRCFEARMDLMALLPKFNTARAGLPALQIEWAKPFDPLEGPLWPSCPTPDCDADNEVSGDGVAVPAMLDYASDEASDAENRSPGKSVSDD